MEYKKSGMKIFALFIVVIMVVSISACAVSRTTEDERAIPRKLKRLWKKQKTAEPVKVGMIASGFGTQSYNDDVLDGVLLVRDKLGLEEIHLEVPEVADAEYIIRTLISQGFNFFIIPSAKSLMQ